MKKYIFYSLTGIVFLLAACKKDKPDEITYPTTNVKLNPVALEFVQLPVGRYFIYKDPATGSIDSVRVTQSIIETKFQPTTPPSGYLPCLSGYNFETFTLTLTKINGTASQDWFKGIASCNASVPCGLHPAVIIDSNLILYDQLFTNTSGQPFVYPYSFYQGQGHILIPAITIEGTVYTDVHEFVAINVLQPTHPSYQAVTHYWVKGIGIIKKETITYNLVKTSLLERYG